MKTVQKITKGQLSKIHVLLTQMNLLGEKQSIVHQFTNGRETSSKEMTMKEASDLLRWLSQFDPCDRMRGKVFALAYDCGIIYGDTPEDKKMNAAKLNVFLLHQGAVKKEIKAMNKDELIKVVSQFEQMKKNIGKSNTNKAITAMLESMNIQSSGNR